MLAIVVLVMVLGFAMNELNKAPLEDEVIVEMDMTSEADIAEKREIIEQLLAKGYWIVENREPDRNHVEYVLHGLIDDNKNDDSHVE